MKIVPRLVRGDARTRHVTLLAASVADVSLDIAGLHVIDVSSAVH